MPTKVKFNMGDDAVWDGFTNGDRWNGWDVVYVTTTTRDTIARHMADQYPDQPDTYGDIRSLQPDRGSELVRLVGYCTQVVP